MHFQYFERFKAHWEHSSFVLDTSTEKCGYAHLTSLTQILNVVKHINLFLLSICRI